MKSTRRNQRWYQPEDPDPLAWVPIPNLTQATVAQRPVQTDDLNEQVSRVIVWYQPDTGAEYVRVPTVVVATPVVDQQADPSEQVWNYPTWYQPDAEIVPGPLRAARYGATGADNDPAGTYGNVVGNTAGLVSYYRLDEPFNTQVGSVTSGWMNVYDALFRSAGEAIEGRWTGKPVNAKPGLLSNDTDTSAGFDGASFITVPNAKFPVIGTSDFSVELLFRTSSGNITGVAQKASSGSPDKGWFLSPATGQFDVSDGTTEVATPSSSWNDGLVHIAHGVRRGATLQFWVDGALIKSITGGATIDVTTTADYTIGTLGGVDFIGDMDEVAVYTVALAPDVISRHAVLALRQAPAAYPYSEWVEYTSNQPVWFAPDAEVFGVPPFARSSATVAQQAGLNTQPDWSEQFSRVVTWFQPDAEQAWTPAIFARSSQDVVEVAFAWSGANAYVTQAVAEVAFALLPDAPLFDWTDQSAQFWNYPTWFWPDTGAEWVPIVSAAAGPTTAQLAGLWQEQVEPTSTAQTWYQPEGDEAGFWVPLANPSSNTVARDGGLWQEQPYPETGTQQTWFAPDAEVATSLANPSSVTTPQEPIQVDDPSEQVNRTIVWFAPDEAVWTPLPFITQATTAQEPVQQPSADEDVDRTQRWFQDEHLAWVPVPRLTADAFPLKQEPDWSEQASNAVVWFAPDAEVQTALPFETEATVAQEPIQQPEPDEQLDRTIRWYQEPDDQLGAVPFQPSTATTAQQAAATQRPDWSEEADRTITWFAPDEQAPYGIPPFQPSTATAAQDAGLWIDGSGQQDASNAQFWFQDETCQFINVLSFITTATVPQQAALWPEQPFAWNDWTPWFAPEEAFDGRPPRANAPTTPDYGWDAQLDRDLTIRWYQPELDDDEFWVPIPAETEATVAQEPIQQPDPSESVDLAVRWFQDEHSAWVPLANPSSNTTPQDAGLWQEQPGQEASTQQTWFAEDAEVQVALPFETEATVAQQPITQPDWSESADRAIVWFAPDELAWVPFTLAPPPPSFPAAMPEQPEQVDLGIVWFAPDEQAWVPQPVQPTRAAIPQVESLDEQLDHAITWFQDEHLAWVPRPVDLTQEPFHVDGADEQLDHSIRWFQDEHLAWTPNPGLPSEPTAFAWLAEQPEQLDLTIRWYQPEDDYLGVPPFAPSTATVAQQAAAIQAYEVVEQRDLSITWYQEPDDQLGAVPFARTTATVAQQAGLWIEQPYPEAGNAVRWYQPEDAYESPLPYAFEPFPPTFDGSLWQEQPYPEAGNYPTWYQPEDAWENPRPYAFSPIGAAAEGGLWQEQPYPEGGNQPVWYQPEDAWETPVPYGYEPPTTPSFAGLNTQPSADEQVDHAIRWFAPDAEVWTDIPNLTQPTVAQRIAAEQAYERVEQLDLTIRWYQPEDDWLGYSPLTYGVTIAKVGATDAALTLVAGTDANTLVRGSDAHATQVTGGDAGGTLVGATDATSVLVTASDQ